MKSIMKTKFPLHTEAKKTLTEHIKTILSNCKIDKGIPDFNDTAYPAIEKYLDAVRKHKNKWMGNEESFNLLFKQIVSYLDQHLEKRFEFSGNLKDIDGTKGITDLSKKIILVLDSIPREYFLFFELPAAKGIGVKEILLTDDIALMEKVSNDDFSEIKFLKRTKGLGLLGIYGHSSSLEKGLIYIRIRIKGYFKDSIESILVKKALSKFKQVVLLGSYLKILVATPKSGALPEISDLNTSKIIVWDPLESCYVLNNPKALSDYISKIVINENVLKPDRYDLLFDKFENKDNPTPADKVTLLKKRFNASLRLLNAPDDDKDSERIKTAIEWAFDSLTNDNGTFAFIQACIGVEAVLGDEKNEGNIAKTLADRCAYLIGNSITKRKKIKEKFLKMYDDRSKLIHGRKAYLNQEESNELSFAQNILRQVILKEISYKE